MYRRGFIDYGSRKEFYIEIEQDSWIMTNGMPDDMEKAKDLSTMVLDSERALVKFHRIPTTFLLEHNLKMVAYAK